MMTKIVDFHSHILPSLDHGCEDIAQSLSQISLIQNAGTDMVVATSHFYPGRMSLSDFLDRRESAVSLLLQNLSEDMPQIAVGAEVHCYPGLENMVGIENLCIKGTRCMLLEMPLGDWTDAHFETVDALSNDGYTLLMAHIDRYSEYDVDRLMQLDVQAQVNAVSLCSFLKRRRVKKWFDQDRVFAIGSDLHGSEAKGYNHFPKGLSVLGEETLGCVMSHSADLLQDAIWLN